MPNTSCTYGTAVCPRKNVFTKTGQKFVGWSTRAGRSVKYVDGQSVINLTSTNGGTITLYAVWEPMIYEITADMQGEQAARIHSMSITASGSTVTRRSLRGSQQ